MNGKPLGAKLSALAGFYSTTGLLLKARLIKAESVEFFNENVD
jgi:hypothetical protein